MFKLFATAIVVSDSLVLWHQENVQIRRHLKEQNVFRLLFLYFGVVAIVIIIIFVLFLYPAILK
jgi:hypothetical protein